MFEKVVKALSEQLNIPQEKIKPDHEIVKDLGADSLDVVELLMTLEDDTGKTIPEDKVTDLKTVQDVIDLLQSL